jgi:hypothetical protein
MFSAIYYKSLRNSEFIQFIRYVLEIVESNDPEVLKVKSQVDDLKALLDHLNLIYKPDLYNAITSELRTLDQRRDNAFIGIKTYLRSYKYYFEEPVRHAAKLLLDSLAGYGTRISRMNYQAESSVLESIIARWQNKPDLAAAIDALNLKSWVAEMKTANNLFNSRYLDRIKDDAKAPDIKVTDLRKEIIQSYRELISHIEAYATLSDETIYFDITKQINQLIGEYQHLIVARSKKKAEGIPIED